MHLPSLRRVRRVGPLILVFSALVLVQLTLLLAGSLVFAQAPALVIPKAGPSKVQSPTTKPDWSELTPAQKVALSPLAPAWSGISEPQKRKWIALSQNFPSLSAAERATLHGRMTEWASLSAAQRNQARLNFAQTKQLSTEEKKAHWEAYQALSPEQKKHLAATSQAKSAGAAPAVTPFSSSKLATVPTTRSESKSAAPAAPLPRPGRVGASSPKAAAAASAPVTQP